MTAFARAPALRRQWFAVARADEVAPGPIAVEVLAERLVLFRHDGVLTALPDRCPHREMPLSLGQVEARGLVCPYHGWTFTQGGRCVVVPSSPGEAVPTRAHVEPYNVREAFGLVWVCLDNPAGELFDIAQDHDARFRRINTEVDSWHVAATRMVDNFLDVAHFPYVHTSTLGPAADPVVAPVQLEQLDADFFGYRYEVLVANEGAATAASGLDAPVLRREMSTGFWLPTVVRSTIRYETGLEHIILLCSTPVDDARSLFTFVIWRNDDHAVPAEEVIAFDRAIGAEDKRALERIPGTLPLGQTGLVSVQADRCSVEWRRRFAALVAGSTG